MEAKKNSSIIKDLAHKECMDLLSSNYIGHLAFISGQNPYTVPITYYYDQAAKSIISYSDEGHKIEALRQNPTVSLGVYKIKSIENWNSVLVHGTFQELHASTAKQALHQFTEGVRKVIGHKARNFIENFSSKNYSGGMAIVYKINILSIQGKHRGH
ncbi:pyridoxamine 5'-phosphate oxidase family protein [Gramella sp. AN32]|uniref:Pyridoxamine 5'-phosphate oxidase family protein n=1 Tax=Christiangramia antarctica TaxID=2058158 RepID=A0ABW5X7T3_9FLAO|nr:pyridoxamine 5'-phosphate oxidase family protein [Gramella sp. AN32]MCM4157875.1 flavin mononucleotide-binding protein [Gramella sp. AN32]